MLALFSETLEISRLVVLCVSFEQFHLSTNKEKAKIFEMFLFLFYIEKDTIYMNYKVRQIYKYVLLAITYCLSSYIFLWSIQ